MGKVGRPSNVAAERPPFKLVLLIARGIDTPTAMGEALGRNKSTVVFHLNRLRKAHLIRRGEKKGKRQPYEINWTAMTKIFIDAVSVYYTKRELERQYKTLKKETMGEEPEVLAPVEVLAQNSYLQNLLKAGIEQLAHSPLETIKSLRLSLLEYLKAFRSFIWKVELNLQGEGEEFRCFRRFIEIVKEESPKRWRHPGNWDWLKATEQLGYIKQLLIPC